MTDEAELRNERDAGGAGPEMNREERKKVVVSSTSSILNITNDTYQ